MLSARACNAQHASDAASRAAMRERFERTVTLFSPDDLRPHPEEGASSAFTRVVDALLAPVSKDGGGPMLRDGGFRRLLSMRPNVARAGEDTPDRNAGPRYRETAAISKNPKPEANDAQSMMIVPGASLVR